MLKKSRKIFLFLAVIVSSLFLAGCTESADIQTEDGEIISYTKEEAAEVGGFFLRKDDDTYQKLLSAGVDDSIGTYVWYTDLDHLIPELTSEKEAIVYISETDRPTMYEFIEMKDMGYTVGLGFKGLEKTTEDGKPFKEYTFDTNLFNEFSPAAEYVDTIIEDLESVKITEVNGREFKESMLTPEGFMKGLTKNAMYKFWFYEGTKYDSINIMADSRLFLENMSYFSKKHKEVKDVYFEVEIPKDMPNGYYVIDGGMFKYNVPIQK